MRRNKMKPFAYAVVSNELLEDLDAVYPDTFEKEIILSNNTQTLIMILDDRIPPYLEGKIVDFCLGRTAVTFTAAR
jgi:hypothetical protein